MIELQLQIRFLYSCILLRFAWTRVTGTALSRDVYLSATAHRTSRF